MLVIRLARVGRKKQAMFRVVVADKRRTPTGRFVAQIGHYDPHAKEFAVDQDQLQAYLKDGAQPSSTMVKLLQRAKIKLPEWAAANLVVKNKPPKAKKGESEAAAPTLPVGVETKAEETAAEVPAVEGAPVAQSTTTPVEAQAAGETAAAAPAAAPTAEVSAPTLESQSSEPTKAEADEPTA